MVSVIPDSRIVYVPRPGRLSAFVQSRIRPLDINLATVTTVLDCCDLTLTAAPRNLPNARRNRNLIVQTTHGRQILKLYRPDWQPSTIQFEHSILAELARIDSPAPRLRTAVDGSTFVALDGRYYAVFDFIPGKTYTSSFLLRPHRLKLMALAGHTLARLHKDLRGFQPAAHHHLGFGDYHGRRHRDMAWHVNMVAELKTASGQLLDPDALPLADKLVWQADHILAELDRLDTELGSAPLPRLVIHGDYGLHNLLFQSTRHATPVDFELARLEWRLCDLVSCLSKLQYATGELDFESMRAFMQGYHRTYPIDAEEWAFFPQVWRFYRLMGAIQYWKSYFETSGPIRKLHSAHHSIHQADWALANPANILAIHPTAGGVSHV